MVRARCLDYMEVNRGWFEPFVADGVPVRAAVGLADDATRPLTESIEARLRAHPLVVDLVRYRVGPSIAAHTGPGTAGGFWWPAR